MAEKQTNSIPAPAKRLRQLLADHKLTQRELAEKIFVDPRYISMIACGRRGLSKDMAVRIADCFPGTRVQWLLGLDDFITEDARTAGIIQFHRGYEEITKELIESHGYQVTRYDNSQHQTVFSITAPNGEVKTIPALQYHSFIGLINDCIEGLLLLGFHPIKDGAKEYTGRCF